MVNKEVSKVILNELDQLGEVFGQFHQKSGLHCPPTCGKCCFKPDIYCSPYELLPLAYDLLEKNKAELYLEEARKKLKSYCILLEVINEKEGTGRCGAYQFRPFTCRAFGVAARQRKNNDLELSICKTLKEIYPDYSKIESNGAPVLETIRRHLDTIDPQLSQKQYPINHSLVIIIEQILLWKQYQE